MLNHWPTDKEIEKFEILEKRRAFSQSEEPHPICYCGQPGWACECEETAKNVGFWRDGKPYKEIK